MNWCYVLIDLTTDEEIVRTQTPDVLHDFILALLKVRKIEEIGIVIMEGE